MRSRVIVSLISDQTVPNILFIKEKGFADFYYFISTEMMEKRDVTINIIKSLNLDKKQTKTVVVIEDSVRDIDEELTRQIDIEDDDQLLVNITGGTKLMSLAAYNFFSRKGIGEIFYIPIKKNELRQVFPLKRNKTSPISKRLNLFEYLTSYGVVANEKKFKKKNDLLKTEEVTDKLFHAFVSDLHDELFNAAEEIRLNKMRGKKLTEDDPNKGKYYNLAQVFASVGVKWEKEGIISKDETKYITGEWFEEFVYPKIKRWLNKGDDEIGMGLQLTKGGANNEYDVMFTHNNALYVIECKTDVADDSEGKISYLFTNTLYKSATLKKEFGLWVNYYLFALNDFSKLTEGQKKRAKQLGIKLVGIEILSDETKFEEFIKK